MDQWDKVVMDRLDETLIDLALDIGFRMGEQGEAFRGDSREAVQEIFRAAVQFEKRRVELGDAAPDYLRAVQAAAERCSNEFRET